MLIKKCKIHSFGSILDQEINFAPSGLSVVEAHNYDTGGASGAGKSMLFKAIEYALCLLPISAKQFENRQTGRKPHVELGFVLDNDEYVIERQLKNNANELKIIKNGQVIRQGGKEAEAYLFNNIFKLPSKDFLLKILHKKQGEKNFFINLSPKQSFTVLSEVLNLNKYEQLLMQAADKEKELKINYELKSKQHEELLANSDKLKNELTTLRVLIEKEEPNITAIKEHIDNLQNQINILTEEKDDLHKQIQKAANEAVSKDIAEKIAALSLELKNKEENELKVLENRQKILLEEKQRLLMQIKTAENKYNNDVNLLNKQYLLQKENYENGLIKIKEEIKTLSNQLAHLQEQKCPVCLRIWDGPDLQNKINEIQRALNEKYGQQEKIKTALQSLSVEELKKKQDELWAQFEQIKTELHTKYEQVEKEKENNEAQINIVKTAIKKLNEEILLYKQMASDSLKAKVSSLTDKINVINAQIKNLEAELNKQAAHYNDLSLKIEKHKAIIQDIERRLQFNEQALIQLKEELANIQNTINILSSIKKWVKIYISYLFTTFLDTMIGASNDILSKIPNAAHISLSYDIGKELKNGKTKEGEIVIKYASGEYLDVPFESFSGGEQTSIGLALDLAFVQTLMQYIPNESIPSLWILDEPFDGLDVISKSAFLDVIKLSGRNVLVVDHDKIIKEMAESQIVVKKINGLTSIEISV